MFGDGTEVVFTLPRCVNAGAAGGRNQRADAASLQGKHIKYQTILSRCWSKEEFSCGEAEVASAVPLSVAPAAAGGF